MNITTKKLALTLCPVSLALFAWGCSNPADDVTEAKVSEVEESEGMIESEETTEGTWYVFDQENSSIEFTGSKVTGSHDGGFKLFSGKILVVDGKAASNSDNYVEIDMDSTWSDSDRLTGHLKSADFFNAPEIPTSKFELSELTEKSGVNGETHVVTGKLTLHGVTKAISFPATIVVGENDATLNAEFFINRFDFDIKYPGKTDDLIREEVVIRLEIQAEPETAA